MVQDLVVQHCPIQIVPSPLKNNKPIIPRACKRHGWKAQSEWDNAAATPSGVPQPAAAESTEEQEEKQVKRTSDTGTAEKGTAAKPPGSGPRNALTHNVADAILKDMRRWYEERLDGEDVSVAWKHLQQCLFRTVTVPLHADIWRNPNFGAAQPEDESEGQVMVVSKEHVAKQVREVIEWREKWLAQEGLPGNTLMNNKQKDAFLKASKEEYHNRPDQRERQHRDAASVKNKQYVKQRKKSRWARN